jgi:hypothetical protein
MKRKAIKTNVYLSQNLTNSYPYPEFPQCCLYEDGWGRLNIYRQSVDLIKCADQDELYSYSSLHKDPLTKGKVNITV